MSCLESLSSGCLKSGGRITAAAVTGPARQPRPASSVPASGEKVEKLDKSILLNYKKVKLFNGVCCEFNDVVFKYINISEAFLTPGTKRY